ncbi:hypothetical protein EJP77_12235 [Paenibacillus zeisoli]|uniref:Terpene synthase n=1 Tax=Paenibacillus zeisoli TaxID=2496267 RepID=A0A3S1D577_9BACL|nr:hypothetical protein [Paenibacillus zeisoli]RUT30589.1 hypothetical protein EJP77_12235 [Paenibacillus zeisoli]
MRDWFDAYREDMQWAFDEAERIIGDMPGVFGTTGRKMLDEAHALKEDNPNNYISFLLPLWLRSCSELSIQDSRRLSLANIFGMMYFQTIDYVMDSPGETAPELLPLANLLQLEFINIYSSYFPAESPFWNYYRTYLKQWADAVTYENEENYYLDNPVRMAHKAAPIKLSVAGSLILSEQISLIPKLEEATDYTLITLQMLDDVMDWKKDMKEDNYNSLVAFVRAELQIPTDQAISPEQIEQVIYIKDGLNRYAEQAAANHLQVEDINELVPHLRDFSYHLLEELRNAAKNIEKDRIVLQTGGLNYWLSKNV